MHKGPRNYGKCMPGSQHGDDGPGHEETQHSCDTHDKMHAYFDHGYGFIVDLPPFNTSAKPVQEVAQNKGPHLEHLDE